MSSYFLHEKEGSSEGSHGREPGGRSGTTPGGGKRGSFHGRDSHVLVVWIRDVYVSPSEVIEWPEFMNPGDN